MYIPTIVIDFISACSKFQNIIIFRIEQRLRCIKIPVTLRLVIEFTLYYNRQRIKIIYCIPHPIGEVEVAIFMSMIDEMKKHFRLD